MTPHPTPSTVAAALDPMPHAAILSFYDEQSRIICSVLIPKFGKPSEVGQELVRMCHGRVDSIDMCRIATDFVMSTYACTLIACSEHDVPPYYQRYHYRIYDDRVAFHQYALGQTTTYTWDDFQEFCEDSASSDGSSDGSSLYGEDSDHDRDEDEEESESDEESDEESEESESDQEEDEESESDEEDDDESEESESDDESEEESEESESDESDEEDSEEEEFALYAEELAALVAEEESKEEQEGH